MRTIEKVVVAPPLAVSHWTPQATVGGTGFGSWFKMAVLDNGTSGDNVVNKLEFWADNGAIIGVQMTFSGGNTYHAGNLVGNPNNISYNCLNISPGETFISVTMWPVLNDAGVNEWCGRIEIETTSQSFAAGASRDAVSGYIANTVPVGCGVCVGYNGTANSGTIFSFGLIFYDNVDSVVLDNVMYPIPPLPTSITPLVIDNMTAIASGGTTNWQFENTVALEQSQSFAKSFSVGYFASVTVKAAFWGVGLEASAGWNQTATEESTVSSSQTISTSWNIGGQVTDGNQVDAVATIYAGKCSIAYTGVLTITFTDESSEIINVNGIYNNVSYGYMNATATYSDSSDNNPKPLVRGWLKEKRVPVINQF